MRAEQLDQRLQIATRVGVPQRYHRRNASQGFRVTESRGFDSSRIAQLIAKRADLVVSRYQPNGPTQCLHCSQQTSSMSNRKTYGGRFFVIDLGGEQQRHAN